jgi:hypothetical protein
MREEKGAGVSDSTPREETSTATPTSRDAAYWAPKVAQLQTGEVPEGAINLNVSGRRVAGPIQGFGKMWQKTYKVILPGRAVTPPQVIATWKQRFPEFWPEGNYFYGPLTGIAPGEVAVLNLTMPGKLKLSTGVLVMYADDESFTLMTPEGHMFAGWITFSAAEATEGTLVQVQVLMRASDPLMEMGLGLFGHRQEDRFWESTLKSLAAHFGLQNPRFEMQAVCVDKKRHWSAMRNVRQNSALRSGAYMMGAPFRALAKPFRRNKKTVA